MEAGLFFSGETGFSVVVPIVGEDLKGVGPAKLHAGKDVDGPDDGSGEGSGRAKNTEVYRILNDHRQRFVKNTSKFNDYWDVIRSYMEAQGKARRGKL